MLKKDPLGENQNPLCLIFAVCEGVLLRHQVIIGTWQHPGVAKTLSWVFS